MKKLKSKVNQILESTTDEREISENSKLFKAALDRIVFTTDIIWFLSIIIGSIIIALPPISFGLIPGKIFFSIILGETIMCFLIDIITFIYIKKTIDIKTFGGSINKKTYSYSLHFLGHILFMAVCISVIFGLKINDIVYFGAVAACIIINMIINKYFTKKYNK